jgi:hypothetical protein
MIEGLDQLCKAIGIVDRNTARQVVEEVNRKLGTLLRAQVVKFYWSRPAEDGTVLEPIAFINDTRAPDPQQFTVTAESRGVLHWAFRSGKPLWLEDLRRTFREPIQRNLLSSTDPEITTADLALGDPPTCDSVMVVPIFERGIPHGLYLVELQTSGFLWRGIAELLRGLGESVGTLVYNADMYDYDAGKTRDAVRKFFDSVKDVPIDPVIVSQRIRTAFVARPYGGDFTSTQERVETALAKKGVQARHFTAQMNRAVIDEIVSQVRNSHFCVVDLTGNNPNVLTEVGMMIALGKKLVVLRRRGDDSPMPFDVSHYTYWEYEPHGADELYVWSPADNTTIPLDDVLGRFLETLPQPFWSAERWEPEPPERTGRFVSESSTAAPTASA